MVCGLGYWGKASLPAAGRLIPHKIYAEGRAQNDQAWMTKFRFLTTALYMVVATSGFLSACSKDSREADMKRCVAQGRSGGTAMPPGSTAGSARPFAGIGGRSSGN
jgi:hypothetical protein